MESTIADVLYEYALSRLSIEQLKRIHSEHDLLRTIEDDDEDEIKEEIWNIVKHSLHWKSLIDVIRQTIEEDEDEEIKTDTDGDKEDQEEESSDTE